MILNFFKVAFRNMKKYLGYSLINVTGLSLGIAAVLLIFLFVQNEVSYDTFYPNSQSVYRLNIRGKMGEQKFNSTTNCSPMAAALQADFPEVMNYVRFYIEKDFLLSRGDIQFVEDRVVMADSTFFQVFPVQFVKGNPVTALGGTRNLVLSERMAHKYFGKEDPMGKIVTLNGDEAYTVTGVFANVPGNSHFHFDIVAPLVVPEQYVDHWFADWLYVYLQLEPGADYREMEAKLPDFVLRHIGPRVKELVGIDLDAWEESGNEYAFYLEPEESIHLNSTADYQIEPTSNMMTVQIFSVIAFFILLLACVNFLNLTTARSYTRAREVGVRKVFGSSRRGLISQFLSETFLLTLFAMLLALLEVELFLPYFNNIAQKSLSFLHLFSWSALGFMVGMILFIVLFAGSYTALSLSGYSVISVLKGLVSSGRRGKKIRFSLVVFQFVVALVILVCAMVIKGQVNFMQNKKLGFDKERILVVDRAYVLNGQQRNSIRQEFKRFSGIENVGFSSHLPGRGANGWSMYPEGASSEELIHFRTMYVDQEFLEVLGMEIQEGRMFSEDRLADTSKVIVNSAGLRALGYDKGEGKFVYAPGFAENVHRTPLEIIGVMPDFHFESMREEIAPLLIFFAPNFHGRYMMVKLAPGNVAEGVRKVQDKWDEMSNGQPFEYFFLNNDFNNLFKAEVRVGHILTIFTIFCFIIACLGLLGLVSFEMQQRVKEIGVRKVLGCSEINLIGILSRDMLVSVGLANIIAWPLIYFIMHRWLSHFAYRIPFPWFYFVLALVISMILSWVIVSVHCLKAARANPVKSLRSE